MKKVFVKDGEDILVIAEVDVPSASDPVGLYPAVAHVFRVIANAYGPTLKLIPIVDYEPSLVDEHHLKTIKGK